MSDDAKPFEATAQRIERARREGDLARAGEFSANVAFAAAVGTVAAILPTGSALARTALERGAAGREDAVASVALVALALVPILAAAGAAVVATAAQGGGLRVTPVAFKSARVHPFEGLKRIVSRDTTAHALRSALAFAVAGAAMLPALRACMTGVVAARGADGVAAVAWHAAARVAWIGCAVGAAFAVAEVAAARRSWLRRLRMSFEERKRELKEQDGDPAVRGRRASLHRALLRGGLARMKDAAFVVANPTHVAIALAYRPPAVPVPVVLVRAADAVARAVRTAAAERDIPVIENVALARALYRDAVVDRPIPHAYYVAVAEIVAALQRAEADP